jgi:hypothetical protein
MEWRISNGFERPCEGEPTAKEMRRAMEETMESRAAMALVSEDAPS